MTALVIGTGPVKVISKPNVSQLFTSERLVKFSSALLIMSFASLVSSTATIITAVSRFPSGGLSVSLASLSRAGDGTSLVSLQSSPSSSSHSSFSYNWPTIWSIVA